MGLSGCHSAQFRTGWVFPKGTTPVDYAEALGEAYLSFAKHNHRKNGGHYQTPAYPALRRFNHE